MLAECINYPHMPFNDLMNIKTDLAGCSWAHFGISPGLHALAELRTKRQRSARESGRQVECPYRVADKASALRAGSDIPKSAY